MKLRVLTSVAVAAVLAASLAACHKNGGDQSANTGNTADMAATAPAETSNTTAMAGNDMAGGNMAGGNMAAGNMASGNMAGNAQ